MVIPCHVRWREQDLILLSELAVYWPSRQALIVADPHFGKDASFRSAGIPIPAGTTTKDIDRLSRLMTASEATTLIILGDFFHNAGSRQPATMALLADWRKAFAHVDIINIQGNHDRHAGDPPDEWNIEVKLEPWEYEGLRFRHHPSTIDETDGICGHVHPAVRLLGRRKDRITLPCFWLSESRFVLPAFGGFTGSGRISPQKADRIFVAADGDVIEIQS